MSTKINWTNETWNSIIGCTKISEGCKECHAEKMAYRLAHIEATKKDYRKVTLPFGGWEGNTHFVESALDKPTKWKKIGLNLYINNAKLQMFHSSTKKTL